MRETRLENNAIQLPILQLAVPCVENTQHILFDTSRKRIEQELMDLPYADINAALMLAKKKLQLLNRFSLSARKREEVTTPFNIAFQKFLEFFRSFHTSARYSRPPSPENLREMALFTQEMSFSYKHILLDYLDKSKKPKDLASSLYNTMYYIGQTMLQSYEQNHWQNSRLWQETHFLYACAEEQGVLDLKIPNIALSTTPSNIGVLYKQLLLTALADPYQLPAGWHWPIFDYAGNVAQHAELHKPETLTKFQYGFAIRLDISKPPIAIRSLPQQSHSSLRVLLPQGATNIIFGQMHGARAEKGKSNPDLLNTTRHEEQTRFLQTLYHQWAEKPQRSKKREPVKESIGFVWGVNDLHKMLNPEERHRATILRRPVEVQHRSIGLSINESDDGICIYIKNPGEDAPHNGQIIGLIRKTNTRKELGLGIIQWSAMRQGQQLVCGVKKLSTSPKAVFVAKEDAQEDRQPALLLQHPPQSGEPAVYLLARTGLLKAGKTVLINPADSDNWLSTKPGRVLNRTACVDLFELEKMG